MGGQQRACVCVRVSGAFSCVCFFLTLLCFECISSVFCAGLWFMGLRNCTVCPELSEGLAAEAYSACWP